jgi:hypothetical protein
MLRCACEMPMRHRARRIMRMSCTRLQRETVAVGASALRPRSAKLRRASEVLGAPRESVAAHGRAVGCCGLRASPVERCPELSRLRRWFESSGGNRVCDGVAAAIAGCSCQACKVSPQPDPSRHRQQRRLRPRRYPCRLWHSLGRRW